MFKWLKNLLGVKAEPSDYWRVIEQMQPMMSHERFLALEIPQSQRPTIEALLEGSLKPEDTEAVAKWNASHDESLGLVDATVLAIQHALGSDTTTYVFGHELIPPLARIPKFIDEQSPALIFNDQTNYFQITSIQELLAEHGVSNFTLERLDPDGLGQEMKRRAARFQGVVPSQTERAKYSVTIECAAADDERLAEPLEAKAIVQALATEGLEVAEHDIELEKPIESLGLYHVHVSQGEDNPIRISVWVVPNA